MTNLERYLNIFADTFGIDPSKPADLEYQSIKEWDSVGHMGLIAGIEDAFHIMMDTDDIIDFSSLEKGKQILRKYDVIID
ncbi:MAG: acyl carrier protein [Peptococcaceae bacterium]|nr:acyl carrier protein [Peptococcaceae bacterium]